MISRAAHSVKGLLPGALELWPKGARVLYFHGVAEHIFDPVVQALHLPLAEFDRQIQYLRRTYDIISMEEFEQRLRARSLRSRHVVLTFDDGYRNNLTVAAGYLQSYDLPFCVFISTKHIETGWRFPGYHLRVSIWCTEEQRLRLPSLDLELPLHTVEQRLEAIAVIGGRIRELPEPSVARLISELRSHIPDSRWTELDEIFSTGEPLSWDGVRDLAAKGVTIGSHTHSHSILHRRQDAEYVRREVELSRDLITRHIGNCRYFAYPHGAVRDIGSPAYRMVRDGYALGFTTFSAPVNRGSEPHLLPRISAARDVESLRHVMASSKLNTGLYTRWAKALLREPALSTQV